MCSSDLLDYKVINLLGQTLFDLANQQNSPDRSEARDALLRQAVEQFENTLRIDAENVTAHYNLALLYTRLDDEQRAAQHQREHARYKPDENADQAITVARQKSAAANHAAETVVIYDLHRDGAPELPNNQSPADVPETETKP